jgi:beta-1,4-mannosyl-glycoprotein beta-1,4-N-acetylglucosaminyltransferase
MIIDCFTFFNEMDLLEGRLEYLYDQIDYFVIVEGNVTHTGKSKSLNFLNNISRYKPYLDKVLYFPWSHNTANMTFNRPITVDYSSSNWQLENKQRNHISEALKFFDPEDICLIGDVDEIPSKQSINNIKNILKGNPATVLEQEMYAYNLNQKQFRPWAGTVATKVCIALEQTPQTIRDKRWEMGILRESGWHLTYWGGAEHIQTKITNFAHQELINDENSTINYIQSKIDQGQDLWGRNLPYHKADPYKEPVDFLRVFGKYVGIHV